MLWLSVSFFNGVLDVCVCVRVCECVCVCVTKGGSPSYELGRNSTGTMTADYDRFAKKYVCM